jgi:hypothetical protein
MLLEQTMIAYLGSHAGRTAYMAKTLEEAAREHILASHEHYRACMQWILGRRQAAESEREAA